MINRILAEYVSMLTPEMRSDNIFHGIEQLISEGDALVPYVTENSMSMTIKSSIEYKYRPTVRYEVQLFRTSDSAIGELSVVFRTQSAALIEETARFFSFVKQLENKYLRNNEREYSYSDNKFTRTLILSGDEKYTSEQISRAISDYIGFFDGSLKGYLTRRQSGEDIEANYLQYIRDSEVII